MALSGKIPTAPRSFHFSLDGGVEDVTEVRAPNGSFVRRDLDGATNCYFPRRMSVFQKREYIWNSRKNIFTRWICC